MGGDDSQKLLPRRGSYSPPGRKPPAPIYEINNVTETPVGFSRVTAPGQSGHGLSYRPPGSFLVSTGGSILSRAEAARTFCSPAAICGWLDR